MVIYKQRLEIADIQKITIPGDSQFLSLQAQDNKPVLWYIVGADINKEFTLITMTTGRNNGERGKYLGTYQLNGGAFVGHVFIKEEGILK